MSAANELSELFDRDPCKLSEQDISKIVVRMRENQANYELGAKPAAKAAKPKTAKTNQLLSDLGLADDVKDLELE